MSSPKKDSVSLDDLCAGKLPKRVLDAIGDMDIPVEEWLEWADSRPSIRIVITDKEVQVETRKRLRLQKLVATIASVAGILWAIVELIVPYIMTKLSF